MGRNATLRRLMRNETDRVGLLDDVQARAAKVGNLRILFQSEDAPVHRGKRVTSPNRRSNYRATHFFIQRQETCHGDSIDTHDAYRGHLHPRSAPLSL